MGILPSATGEFPSTNGTSGKTLSEPATRATSPMEVTEDVQGIQANEKRKAGREHG